MLVMRCVIHNYAMFFPHRNTFAQTILSAPAINQSGRGSLSVPAIPLLVPCEYNSCKIGSPAQGFNQSDRQFISSILHICAY